MASKNPRQVSMENTFDPSHAPFLHNGIVKYSAERAARPQGELQLTAHEFALFGVLASSLESPRA